MAYTFKPILRGTDAVSKAKTTPRTQPARSTLPGTPEERLAKAVADGKSAFREARAHQLVQKMNAVRSGRIAKASEAALEAFRAFSAAGGEVRYLPAASVPAGRPRAWVESGGAVVTTTTTKPSVAKASARDEAVLGKASGELFWPLDLAEGGDRGLC